MYIDVTCNLIFVYLCFNLIAKELFDISIIAEKKTTKNC